MSEDGRFGGSSGTPAAGKPADQDYGFFAAGPVAPPSQFGGPPSQFGGPPAPVVPPARAMPPPPGAVAPQPVPSQFGPPPAAPLAPPAPFGGPPAYGQPPYPTAYGQPPYSPVQRGGLPVWAIVAICVPAGLVVLGILAAIAIPVFLNARSTPVTPDTLGGLNVSADSVLNQTVESIKSEQARRNPGVKSKAAAYGTLAHGYVLMSSAARVNAEQELRNLGATNGVQSFGDVQCAANATANTSLCLRVGRRGTVEVATFGPPDLAKLASVTGEAWAAQPFGGCGC